MFTGLVQQVGRLEQVSFQGEAGRLALAARFGAPLQIGESIAVNGACLTLVEQHGDRLTFDVLRETFDKTALRDKAPGAPLNLERALRLGDPLGGHLVSGHVDGVGRVLSVHGDARAQRWRFAAPAPLLKYIAKKGSICVDGVSLTVNEVDGEGFEVALIPHTVSHTAFSQTAVGDAVNLEIDLVARYVERLLGAR